MCRNEKTQMKEREMRVCVRSACCRCKCAGGERRGVPAKPPAPCVKVQRDLPATHPTQAVAVCACAWCTNVWCVTKKKRVREVRYAGV